MCKIRDKYLFVFNKLFDRCCKEEFLESSFIILTFMFFDPIYSTCMNQNGGSNVVFIFLLKFFYFERHDNGTKHRQSWMKIMSNGRIYMYQSVTRYACVDLFDW